MSSINIEQYSEKAIVVRGNTIQYKDKLLSIGGKWNKMLKGGEGWIFPLTKKPIVEKTLSEPINNIETNSNEDTNISKSENKYKDYKKNTHMNDNSEVILTKKDYLNLISRIEKLEQMILGQNETKNIKTFKPPKSPKSPKLPLLSSIDDDLIPDNYNDNDEEREFIQPLLRKKKNT